MAQSRILDPVTTRTSHMSESAHGIGAVGEPATGTRYSPALRHSRAVARFLQVTFAALMGTYLTSFGAGRATAAYSFTGVYAAASGAQSDSGLEEDTSGNFYGTTSSGGTGGGTIFELAAPVMVGDPYTYSTLYSFNSSTDGSLPIAQLNLKSGVLYGTCTVGGGANCEGTIFSYDISTSTYTVLHALNPSAGDGGAPFGRMFFETTGTYSGYLFGGCEEGYNTGGYVNSGTVWRIKHDGTNFKVVYAFSVPSDIYCGPFTGITDVTVSGVTYLCGATDNPLTGYVFQCEEDGSSFSSSTLGSGSGAPSSPGWGILVNAGGTLYGTTDQGGANGDGSIISVTVGGASISCSDVYDFDDGPLNLDGAEPMNTLEYDGSGKLYGDTYEGGANGYGTIFEFDPGTPAYTKLADLTLTTGTRPIGQLHRDGSDYWGTTGGGGAHSAGTIFYFTP